MTLPGSLSPAVAGGRTDRVRDTDEAAGRWFRLTLAGVLALSLLRLAVVFLSPLELYPDEAQYWLWSRRLAFGYYSKPPLVAWLIGASTAVGGNAEAWVRLPALIVHGLAALVQFKTAERLAGPREGAAAALIYSLMPGVMLSSSAIATDAPLFLFGSCAVWAYAAMWGAETPGRRQRAATALGAALGLAFLSKYAAAYLVVGIALHALISGRARGLWRGPELTLAAGVGLILLAPNLVWNAQHQFSTFFHTVENARVARQEGGLNLAGGVAFLAGQAAVFGPIPLMVLVGAGARGALRRTLDDTERLLLILIAPPLAVVLVEAVVARANANWAATAYLAGCPMVAILLVRWSARRTLWAVALSQGLFALIFFSAMVSPAVADELGLGSALKRARGRAAEARLVVEQLARAQASGPVTAVAVDRRFEFNTLAYYGRQVFAARGSPPLRIWVRESRPHNQAELESPLRKGPEGARVLFFNYIDTFAAEARRDFRRVEADQAASVPLDRKGRRNLSVFVGRDFTPRPRPRVSGLPTPP